MKIFNVGPLEVLLIALLALIVFGPKRLVQVMRDFGKWLRSIAKSPIVRDFVRTTEDLRNLPNELLRESGLDQDIKEVSRAAKEAMRIDEMNTERAKQDAPDKVLPDSETSIFPPDLPAENNSDDPA
ncbi:MAG: twin-arginine translocase TatA/TatE family subunit [Anaerolineaceae bacterium]|nr:twin-arginine translocase TatA/TatE family subunit [Anaerolineaceae bacterium]